ncbi:hypothetical protein [Burkholderia sp. GbtcB21]|uniref:hypothetical protein n=1 Tax=Burkholderia sp. GbtcB21 TaxID=2824766 RepID=UPI001C310BF1|nr:hypothetical protein [Burkholderia sp. GbtcB21]
MAIDKRLFAAAVANGLDPRAAATWHPDLPRTPRVLVPIQVDALVVRAEGGVWADCAMRDPDPDTEIAIEAGQLLPAPFAERATPRARGVHLHWALPDGLTRGVGAIPPDDATPAERAKLNGATFPAIPDRWLVLRIGGGADRSLSRRAVTGWVIEAGGRAPVVTPLDAWKEPGPDATRPTSENPTAAPTGGAPDNRPRKALTALGNGDPAWAAYYDNVTNRLAFHDALDGVNEGPLAYLVCGWYGDPARDVLGDSITSLAAFEARIGELGWSLPAGAYGQSAHAYDRIRAASLVGLETREATEMPMMRAALDMSGRAAFDVAHSLDVEGVVQAAPIDREGLPVGGYHRIVDSWWPKYTLLHGGVVGIGWPNQGIPVAPSGLLGGGDQVGGPPPAGDIRVAIGHTMTDALAALFAATNHSADDARALEAALLGGADQLDEADAASRVDVRVHAASFGSLPGGYVTETIMQRPPAGAPGAPRVDPSKTDPGVFRGKLPAAPGGKGGRGVVHGQALGIGVVASEQRVNPKLGGVKVHADRSLGDIANLRRIADSVAMPPAGDPAPQPVEVKRALPRFYIPSDPVILLQGINRSFKHGADGRFSENGTLPCRVSDTTVRELAPMAIHDLPGGGVLRGPDLLARGVANGSVPPECDALLNELAVLDPGSATFGARASARAAQRLSRDAVQRAAKTYAVEQTIWWASRDLHRDMAPLGARSGFAGTLPCAIAVSPPQRPWVPLHLDWEVEYLSSGDSDWQLGEIDFDAKADAVPPADALPAGIVLRGRALLTPGAAQTAAAAVRQTLDRARQSGGSTALKPGMIEQFHSEMAKTLLTELANMPVGQRATRAAAAGDADLRSVAEALANMDVLAGALDRFHTRLRVGYVADGTAAPASGDPAPAPFFALRAGYLRIRRLRLVDCFGQIVDLAGSSATSNADMTTVIRSEPMTVADRPDLLELSPRFTAPTRLLFRFMAAADDATEARDDRTPLCGFLLPDHLDAELQFHAPDGGGIGAVRFDRDAGVQWEDAPGKPSTVGASPLRAIGNPHLAGIAQGLVDWGVADSTRGDPDFDTALSSLLRVIDTTLWTVDPFGHAGDEHLSLLVGHPVAVMRARLTLEIREPIAPDALQAHRVPVRLGALAQWQDGLLGYFVDDDYRTLHLPDPAAAGFARPLGPGQGFLQNPTRTTGYYDHFADDLGVATQAGASPVDHDFVDPSGVIFLRPGQTVMLTLLMEPHSVVNATCGLLPRKAIGMRREWVTGGLAAIAPTFRFGPVLVDPKRIRMPLAAELNGTWSWCHRVDATTWQEDQVINSNGDGELPRDPVEGQEGWLKLSPEKPAPGSGT